MRIGTAWMRLGAARRPLGIARKALRMGWTALGKSKIRIATGGFLRYKPSTQFLSPAREATTPAN